MSRKRVGDSSVFANPKATKRGPNGRILCRACGKETTPPRRTFCCEDCVTRWKVVNSPGFARKLVRKRDMGRCALCGLECLALKKALVRIWCDDKRNQTTRFKAVRRILGIPKSHYAYDTLWHMDHILPVAEGGGSCGLDNLRTLCRWCHKGETRKLMARLREQRKAGDCASSARSVDPTTKPPDNRRRATP